MKFDESTLEINNVFANRFDYNGEQIECFGIDWECNLGFGRYEFLIEEKDGKLKVAGLSELMDTNDSKIFLRALLNKFADMVVIEE